MQISLFEDINAKSSDSASNRNEMSKKLYYLHLSRIVLAGLLFVTIIAIFVPFMPYMPSSGLDPSWVYGTNQAVAQGLIFGRDFIFTTGPYGSIYTKAFHPATDYLMLIGGFYLSICYGLLILFLLKETIFEMGDSAVFSAGIITFDQRVFPSYLCCSRNIMRIHVLIQERQEARSDFDIVSFTFSSFLLVDFRPIALWIA